MININKKLFFFFSLLIIFLLGANFIFALEVDLPGLSEKPGLPEYARYFFNWGMGIAGTLAALALIFGGLHYLISFGMGKITSAGKDWMKAGIMGLLILLCSYLIAGTINPQLTVFHLEDLVPISLPGNGPTSGTPSGPGTITYKEIPIGTLTENVLVRTINCYDFDENGDPVDGKSETLEFEPTFLNHDRIDCLLKLAEAVEKKAEKGKKLADKIAELMEKCNCQNSCKVDCTKCEYKGLCPRDEGDVGTEYPCSGDCVGASCECKESDCDPCPEKIKEEIEHGPIIVDNTCKAGLDEFRTEYPLCKETGYMPYPYKDCVDAEKNLLNIIETEIEIEKETVKIIRIEVWKKLRLIDQLRYLKEKIKEINLEKDVNVLKNAETELGGCYLVKSYVDFLKIKEEIKKEDKNIEWEETFKDPYTDEDIDISRYCKGFLYDNNQCFHTCRNICPGTDEWDFSCYKDCPQCPEGNRNCLERQKECLKECSDESECPGNSNFANFKDCLTKCRDQCLEVCKKEKEQCYQDCEEIPKDDKCREKKEEEGNEGNCKENCNEDYNKSVNECNTDSQCFINYSAGGDNRGGNVSINENEEKCYINIKSLKACADKYDDFENFEKCAKTSFKCKYCTDQQAGYPDCLEKIEKEYSSSFLYENPQKQRCPDCYEKINGSSCVDVYPETSKCPSCSNCPGCPCFTPLKEKTYIPGGGSTNEPGNVYRICSGECGEYSYNDDPLTFYCRGSWWERWWEWGDEKTRIPTEPLGKEWSCEKNNEIPVGQTVDETEKWAEELMKLINDFVEKTEDMIEYIKGIGEEKDYCQCDSSCNGEEKVCQGGCEYHQYERGYEDPYTGEITYYWDCYCSIKPCAGNPCQKMINLLRGKKVNEDCPKGKEYKGIGWYYMKIGEALEKLKGFTIEERAEILKKLIYSRKKMNECSGISTGFGREIRLLSCERVIDEIIPPIVSGKVVIKIREYGQEILKTLEGYCYGGEAGKILKTSEPLTDNWFCCEKVKKD